MSHSLQALNGRTAPKAQVPERVIQFGEGNFLRAFVDWMVEAMNRRTAFNGSVVIVQPRERNHIEALRAQDGLYHVNLVGLDNGRAVDRIDRVGSVSRALNPYTQWDAFIALADQPTVRFVVSNTTEAGIVFDPSCRLADTPAASYPAKLTQLLYRRYRTFGGDPSKGLVILPCELILQNGRRLHECVSQYISLWQDSLGADHDGFRRWVDGCCSFCSTLVDRIVNGFPKHDIDVLCRRTGYNDLCMVQGEVFHLWVIEHADNLSAAQLSCEWPARQAGLNVHVVDDETPYHQRKLTLLNGPHTVLAPVAWLAGIDIVRDACDDPLIGRFIHRVMYDELLPTLSLPHDECARFADDVLARFRNPFIDHQLTSIMLNSFPKFAARDLPGLKAFLHIKGTLPRCLVLGLAAIVTIDRDGRRTNGTAMEPSDDPATLRLVRQLWATGDVRRVAEGILAADNLWHEDLNALPGLTDLLSSMLASIQQHGIRATVEAALHDSPSL